ncbi:MAG: DNA (cytosine-5-)-methyltransferase [Burkholderiales bacterium RIFCSPLOWO2_12_FULL_61_40]|nr:MAG: DNA (cytosine-5-)-methyltransferase [Burkholderiales bacterium RIFCSPLOWO2_12_FULL_61_40]
MHSLELCAGAGGQAQGLERSGFEHEALVEIDAAACSTLRLNRPQWNVIEGDLSQFDARPYRGVDLVAGGVPCPPFSKAGKQLGGDDERDMFPQAIRVVDETRPQAVMLENVRGLLDAVFVDYRMNIAKQLQAMGYWTDWRLFNAADFGVSQLRPRVVCVAVRQDIAPFFRWPVPGQNLPPTVGTLLHDLMLTNGWRGADAWRDRANAIAPTLVGGSKKHGGPDLGPTRSRAAWAALGVDGRGLANDAPEADFVGMPRLTVRMCARVQGFPDDWQFAGKKTPSYRQVGNAFPPPVAHAVSAQIAIAIEQAAAHRIMRLAA